MTRSSVSKTLAVAAIGGLVAGSAALLTGCAKDHAGDNGSTMSSHHSCKGQNACKGLGGCKTADHSCKGQNACKGLGGCKS